MDCSSDENLMARYQAGDYCAFEALYERYHGRILGYLYLHLRDTQEADDLLQRIFLKLHQNRGSYDENLPFAPWLFSICRNVIIDHFRKHKSIPTSIEGSLLHSHEPHQAHVVDRQRITEALMKGLTEEKRALLRLRFAEGRSYEEISAKLGINPPSARKRISRLVKSLQAHFKDKKGELYE